MLLQIRSHYINQFFGGFHLRRVFAVVRRQDMEKDVPFHDLGHETIQCPSTSSHELKDPGALLLGIERSLDCIDLSPNPSNACQKLFFVFACVSHTFIIL